VWNTIPTHFEQHKHSNFKKRFHETLMKILKDQDGYLEPLSILQLLAVFSEYFILFVKHVYLIFTPFRVIDCVLLSHLINRPL